MWRLFGCMSGLHFLNYWILQWFCVRLTKVLNTKTKKIIRWKLLWVLPLTGWGNDYIYVKDLFRRLIE